MSIDDLRKEIDALDSRIVELLNERAEVAKKIGVVKRQNNLPIHDSGREKKVYSRILSLKQRPTAE